MGRTEYKNNHKAEYYDRIELTVPKRMKTIIKNLASDKGLSVNSYIQDLIRKDQERMFDTMQFAERNQKMLSGIQGNMHDGYNVIFKDGHTIITQPKKKSGRQSLNTVRKRAFRYALFFWFSCLTED